jgi:hypothetical protein
MVATGGVAMAAMDIMVMVATVVMAVMVMVVGAVVGGGAWAVLASAWGLVCLWVAAAAAGIIPRLIIPSTLAK